MFLHMYNKANIKCELYSKTKDSIFFIKASLYKESYYGVIKNYFRIKRTEEYLTAGNIYKYLLIRKTTFTRIYE